VYSPLWLELSAVLSPSGFPSFEHPNKESINITAANIAIALFNDYSLLNLVHQFTPVGADSISARKTDTYFIAHACLFLQYIFVEKRKYTAHGTFLSTTPFHIPNCPARQTPVNMKQRAVHIYLYRPFFKQNISRRIKKARLNRAFEIYNFTPLFWTFP
jgi:hypothetical protein